MYKGVFYGSMQGANVNAKVDMVVGKARSVVNVAIFVAGMIWMLFSAIMTFPLGMGGMYLGVYVAQMASSFGIVAQFFVFIGVMAFCFAPTFWFWGQR